MQKITLNKALKLKKKLTGNISKLAARIQQVNSYPAHNKPVYNSKEVLGQYENEVMKLISLKVAINEANQGIMDKIVAIPEIKARITMLQQISVTEGTHNVGYRETVGILYTAVIGEAERDEMIEKSQNQLEALQDEIDKYNATTEIEVE